MPYIRLTTNTAYLLAELCEGPQWVRLEVFGLVLLSQSHYSVYNHHKQSRSRRKDDVLAYITVENFWVKSYSMNTDCTSYQWLNIKGKEIPSVSHN